MRVNNKSPYLHKKDKPWRAGLITLQGHVHTNPDISEIAYFLSGFMWPPLSKQCVAPCNGIPIPESGKFLPMESGILGFGIRNTAQEIRNPTNDWNPESAFYWQILKSSTWNPESIAWNPESKTVLDSLKGGEMRFLCPDSPVSFGKNWLICGKIVCGLKFISFRVDIALSYDPYFCFGCLRVEVLMLYWWSSSIL